MATHKQCELIVLTDPSSYICQLCRLPDINKDNSNNSGEISNFVTSSDIDLPSIANNLPGPGLWKVFIQRELHFIHLNINSLLSKIDELKIIAKNTGASVIGITESKLDNSVLDGEVNIDGYELVRADPNIHGGGVACYIRNNISYKLKPNFCCDHCCHRDPSPKH